MNQDSNLTRTLVAKQDPSSYTYADACAYLDLRRSTGTRDVRVGEKIFDAYLSGLQGLTREGPPNYTRREQMLMYKNMVVRCDPPRYIEPQIPKFEDALDVTPLEDGRNWRVTAPFYYDTDVELTPSFWRSQSITPDVQSRNDYDVYRSTFNGQWRITIPSSFSTDFASVPRLLWNLLPPTGRYTRAAVVHDYLYRTPGLCTRAQADAVLYEAMKFPCHVGFFTRWTIYLGVRFGGHFAYKGGL